MKIVCTIAPSNLILKFIFPKDISPLGSHKEWSISYFKLYNQYTSVGTMIMVGIKVCINFTIETNLMLKLVAKVKPFSLINDYE